MKQFLIAATFLGLIASCTTEPSATSSTDSETDQQLSAPPISPKFCPVPWEGPGAYYICDSTGVIEHNPTVCRANCDNEACDLIWRCNADCICVSN